MLQIVIYDGSNCLFYLDTFLGLFDDDVDMEMGILSSGRFLEL